MWKAFVAVAALTGSSIPATAQNVDDVLQQAPSLWPEEVAQGLVAEGLEAVCKAYRAAHYMAELPEDPNRITSEDIRRAFIDHGQLSDEFQSLVRLRAEERRRPTHRQIPYSDSDWARLEGMLSEIGLSSKDIELMRLHNSSIGEGQTFLGFQCSLGMQYEVNRSFYGGTGHRWQVVLGLGAYIYFEGDGTPEGMVVVGWNY